ncbi:hypothetical protein STVA_33370 [Allostella vacuolata]|nr:hypothetical protein STVA_33370 [Stella vacuolata]
MSRVERIPLGDRFGGADASRPALAAGERPDRPGPALASGHLGSRPAANRNRPSGSPQRRDWLETKLKGLYDEVAAEPLPPSLQELIDRLDG